MRFSVEDFDNALVHHCLEHLKIIWCKSLDQQGSPSKIEEAVK